MSKVKPVIVLSVICLLVCALLIVTYNATYVDTSSIITDDLRLACEKIDGKSSFALITDREKANLADKEYKNIEKIIKNTDSNTFLFEVIVDGYAADGIDAVIALTEAGAVKGISIVSLAETPGVGTKINNDDFLATFNGVSSEVTIAKGTPGENELSGITGSTYSSKGLAKAVSLAVKAYGVLDKEAPTAETEVSE